MMMHISILIKGRKIAYPNSEFKKQLKKWEFTYVDDIDE